jgi:5,10-methylenetetrahydromethanopterin reductase
MAAQIGLAFDGFVTTAEAITMARQAVAHGAQSLWMAEHLGYRSATGSCMAFATAAPGAMLVPTAISPYLWHPTPVAMEMATLDELAPGRAAIALGVGNPLFLAESGKALVKPIPLMREFVEALRRLWTGEPVHMQGEQVQLAGARMAFTPSRPPPIYIAATGPDMLKLTGRIADGVVLSAALSVASVRESLAVCAEAAMRAGRDPAAFRRAGYLFFSTQESSRAAVDAVRTKLAFVMRNKFLAENVRRSGIPIDHEAVIAAVAKRDLVTAASLIPDEAVEAFSVAGTPAECRKRLQGFIDAGLDEPVISPIGGNASLPLILPILRHFAG